MDSVDITATHSEEKQQEYDFFNGFGGFVNEGKEYEIVLEENSRPPVPWINVIANKDFGFHISESGAGFTWAQNSRENKLTSWSNDPVGDPPSEALYIMDEVTGDIITPVSLGRFGHGVYRIRHGFGYSRFVHKEQQLETELTVFTPLNEPIKLWKLLLNNPTDRTRYLSLYLYVEWVLGTNREFTNPYILTSYLSEHEILCARNVYAMNFTDTLAFIFSNEVVKGFTGDKQEILGLSGSIREPGGLDFRLSNRTGAGYDSCGVIQVSIALQPGDQRTVIFGLGQCKSQEELIRLRNKYKVVGKFDEELELVKTYWARTLGTIQVKTKDKAIDYLVNGWLLYQTIACRINARAAFYQCGGAYGFRDQLQDTFALVFTDPLALKNQIYIACSRQFEEGDVQHWWHPPNGVGVRTRISDDLLWLPYAVAAYIKCTGDYSVLKEEVSYIKAPLLKPDQHDVMLTPEISPRKEAVYEHCKKTIQITHYGAHGLPLMGGGDWNDGMNEVGKDGNGESVWLAWFLYTVLGEFIPLCNYEGDSEYAMELEQKRTSLLAAIEENAWDGEWYLRAYYDNGAKLGSKECDECRIDSISQSWSVISQGARKDRAMKAMQSAWKHLLREEDSMSLLLAPPFDKTLNNPGYIKNYIPGIRENGGQYTHAAVWLAIATAALGEYNMAYRLFTMLNPIHITMDRRNAMRYEKEPYVMIADISLSPPYTGRGGWSWYTGSAGWMYQGLVSWFLGIRKENDSLVIEPATPECFGDYTVSYRYKNTSYEIRVESTGRGTSKTDRMTLDGERVRGNRIKLKDDQRTHYVIVS